MENSYLEKYKKFISHELTRHYLGYVIVGGLSNLLELSYLYLFKEVFGIWYLLASAMTFTIGSVQSFLARKFFVFKDKDLKNIYRQVTLYMIVFFLGIGINLVIISFLVEIVKMYYIVAYIIAVIITGIVGFIWNKFVTFKK